MTGDVASAVQAAGAALEEWTAVPLTQRAALIEQVADGYRRRKPDLAETISRQTGKPRWESLAEVDAMIAKAAHSIASHQQLRPAASRIIGDITAATTFRPVGVLAVLGPFNMPGHLPNGHLMPAVLAGNTVVFKPSELTPQVGDYLAEIWNAAGFPYGVFNLTHGGPDVGVALVTHPGTDGVLFTGSQIAGAAIHRALAGHPEKLLALEMGGNNPLIVWGCADLDAAAALIIQSAFITSGQRCSCARRLIISAGEEGATLIEHLIKWMCRIRVGLYTDDPEPFMGTVISPAAAEKLLASQTDLINRGGNPLVKMRPDPRSPSLLTPGLIDVTSIARSDTEIFGPLLQLIRVPDFPAALKEANQTRYGLSAGLVSDRPDLWEIARQKISAGVLHFNRPLTGARSDLPFGGLKESGNHRASAYYAAHYCSDPVAIVEAGPLKLPPRLPVGISP